MREYERFSRRRCEHQQEHLCAEEAALASGGRGARKRGNETLVNRKIIITTIQKLSGFIAANKGHEIFDGHVVIIFDECHRSQFGDMHTAITKAFKRYNLFGFTGTPIFAVNAGAGGNAQLRTTPQAFGCYWHGDPRNCPPEQHSTAAHTYTIVDAINDKNVLPFRIDYVNTIKEPEGIADKQVSAIDTERALLAPERISQVVGYTLEHFDQKTRRSEHYSLGERRVHGFNALFATASIEAAKTLLQRVQEAAGDYCQKVAA